MPEVFTTRIDIILALLIRSKRWSDRASIINENGKKLIARYLGKYRDHTIFRPSFLKPN